MKRCTKKHSLNLMRQRKEKGTPYTSNDRIYNKNVNIFRDLQRLVADLKATIETKDAKIETLQ
jgi:hypothetical protein